MRIRDWKLVLTLTAATTFTSSCGLIPRQRWEVPRATFERISSAEPDESEVVELLGQPDSVLFVDLDRERFTYRVDGIEGWTGDVPAKGGVELALDLCEGRVQDVQCTPIALLHGTFGKPGRKPTTLPEDRPAWHERLRAQAVEAGACPASGIWAIEAPVAGAFPYWVLVRDGDELYMEAPLYFPPSKLTVFRSDASKSNVAERRWFLECDDGVFMRGWKVEFAFDPSFQVVQATWHPAFHSQAQGALPWLVDYLAHKATSEPVSTGGKRLPWPEVPVLAERLAQVRRAALQGQLGG